MLIDYSVSNYRVIRDDCVISMESYEDEHIDDGIPHEPCSGMHILPSAAIYGPNASGKSTILESMSYMRALVCGSGCGRHTRCMGFGDSDPGTPTAFRIRFFSDHVYEYSLSMANGIVSYDMLSSDGNIIFIRDPNDVSIGRHGVDDNDIGKMEDAMSDIHSNVPFMSICAEHAVGCVSGAYEWMSECIIGPEPIDPSYEDIRMIRDILMQADFGITDITLADDGSGTVYVHHGGSSTCGGARTIDLNDESDGVRRLVSIMGGIIRSLRTGSLLLIDGIERDLHPFVVDRILDMFRGPESNPKGAQILFTSHDPSVPYRNGMGADQVWLTSTDPDSGGTDVRPLLDMISGTERFEDDYLSGRLGSIPMTRPFWLGI